MQEQLGYAYDAAGNLSVTNFFDIVLLAKLASYFMSE